MDSYRASSMSVKYRTARRGGERCKAKISERRDYRCGRCRTKGRSVGIVGVSGVEQKLGASGLSVWAV